MPFNLIIILGPTAVGKTRLAAELAGKANGEIISADSRQVYIGMDIGTGKDYSDYLVNGKRIKYHLIDILPPGEEFNLFMFIERFNSAFTEIKKSGKTPFLVGGTGLYLSAVIQNYKLKKIGGAFLSTENLKTMSIEELSSILLNLNPRLHNTTDLLIKDRIITAIQIASSKEDKVLSPVQKINSLNIGIRNSREEIKKRITERLKKRLSSGMIEEVEQLIKQGVSFEKLNFYGLEYKFVGQYIKGELNYNDMYQKLNGAIHGFAKRQMTWFRKMEREGIKINWIDGADLVQARKILRENYFNDGSNE